MECKKRIFQKEIIRIIYFKEISLSQTRIYLFFYNVFDSLQYILVPADIENQQYRDRAGFNSN